MNTNRLWVIGAVVLIVLMLAGTWFLGVSGQLNAAAASAVEISNVQAQNAQHQITLDNLKLQYEKIDELRSDLKDLQEEVPADVEQTPFISQLSELASANGVTISDLIFSPPEVYVPGDSTDPEVVAAAASVSGGNFYAVPVQLRISGTLAGSFAFLNELQTGTRLFLVHELTLGSTDDDPLTDDSLMGITGQMFVLTSAAPAAPTDGTLPG